MTPFHWCNLFGMAIYYFHGENYFLSRNDNEIFVYQFNCAVQLQTNISPIVKEVLFERQCIQLLGPPYLT